MKKYFLPTKTSFFQKAKSFVHAVDQSKDYMHDLCYAVGVQGGDHTAVAVDAYSELKEAVFFDTAVVCWSCISSQI